MKLSVLLKLNQSVQVAAIVEGEPNCDSVGGSLDDDNLDYYTLAVFLYYLVHSGHLLVVRHDDENPFLVVEFLVIFLDLSSLDENHLAYPLVHHASYHVLYN